MHETIIICCNCQPTNFCHLSLSNCGAILPGVIEWSVIYDNVITLVSYSCSYTSFLLFSDHIAFPFPSHPDPHIPRVECIRIAWCILFVFADVSFIKNFIKGLQKCILFVSVLMFTNTKSSENQTFCHLDCF